jgi:hypothetical protein
VIPEVLMIPLGGKIRQPAGEIVSAFEDLLMVLYHCGAMSAASVGRSVVVGSRRGHQYVGERYRRAICGPTLIILQVDFVHHFINATCITLFLVQL